MARVTVEDCLENVGNRFALIHATTQRVKQIFKNSKPLVNCKNKEIVCALREIASKKVRVKNEEAPRGKKQKRSN